MHQRAKLWSLWLVPAVAALAIATGSVMLVQKHPDITGQTAIALDGVASAAAETTLLAEERASRDLTRTFQRAHAHALRGEVEASAKELPRNAASEDATTLRAAVAAVEGTLADLEQEEGSTRQHVDLRALRQLARSLHARAEALRSSP